MTRLLPRTINLYASSSIYLSSGMAHDPIPISGPLIPTIALWNSTFLLLGKKGDFDFLVNTLPTLMSLLSMQVSFQLLRGTLLTLGIWDASAFISYGTLSPTFYSVMKILQWRNFMGIWVGTLPLTFSLPIYIARRFWLFHFLHLELSRTSLRSPSILLWVTFSISS